MAMLLHLLLILSVLLTIARDGSGTRVFPSCNQPLGVSNGSIPDLRMRASSTKGYIQFGPHRARLTSSRTTTGWCSAKGRIAKEYIQIDLGKDMRLSAFATQGVLVWNTTSQKYDYNQVTKFYLAYKRDNDETWRWRQYRENEVTVTLFKNNDTLVNRHRLLSPHIARYVRLIAVKGQGSMACLKVELYGCPWKNQDGLVSYRVSQGNGRANGPGLGDLRDVGYDGRRLAYGTKRGVLSGGLGQLVDGEVGKNVPWNDTKNTIWITWIGWRDPITEHPTVTFQFSSIRQFTKIRFHVLNQPGAEKLLFGKVVISFSDDGEYYTWKTVFEPSLQKRRMKNRAFFLEVDLDYHLGKYVTCDFYYHGWWILISEVQFESVVWNPALSEIRNDSKKINSQPTVIPTDIVLDVKESGRPKKKSFPSDIILYSSIAAGIVGAILLISGIILCLRRRCKRQNHDPLTAPLRIVNPLKKNSLNRNNQRSYQAAKKLKDIEQEENEREIETAKRKLKEIEEVESDSESECDYKKQMRKQMEDEEELEDVFMRLNSWKMNCGESLFKNSPNHEEAANLRPESREITLEEEKALVLEEMRKLSENSDVPP